LVTGGNGGFKRSVRAEDVFNYIYAVFHSPTYRSRYAEFLKSDFPRVPLTSDRELYRSLCGLGAELVALHLLESPKLEKPIARHPVKGSNEVEKGLQKYLAPGEPEPFVAAGLPRHGDPSAGSGQGVISPLQSALPRLKEGRVYINRPPLTPLLDEEAKRAARGGAGAGQYFEGIPPVVGHYRESGNPVPHGQDAHATAQYFEGVPPEVWNFHIGGYQVCEKWLKDRRGRILTYDDLTHYAKVVTALSETIRLMAEIDAAIPKWPIE